MKAGAKPELSSAWWKKNKAKTLTKTGLSDALRQYEKFAALDKNEDIPKQIKALSDVKRAVAEAFKKSHPKIHKETQAALKKYPKIIDDRIKVLKDLEARVNAAPKQKMGKDVVVWKRDAAKELNSWIKASKSKLPIGAPLMKKAEVKLKLNDDILDVLEDNGDFVTPALMVEDAEKAWRVCEAEIQKKYLEWEKERKKKSVDVATKSLNKDLGGLFKGLQTDLQKIPEARIAKFKARNKQYTKYKVKAGVDLVWEAASFAGGVALTVGSSGAGLALSIVGLCKSAAKMIGMVYDLAIKAETVCQSLEKDLKSLEKTYLSGMKHAKAKLRGAELAKATVSGAFGEFSRPFITSISRCDSNYTLWDNKVAGLEVAARKASKGILDALNACDKCEKELRKEKDKRIVKVIKDLDKLRAKLNDALDKTHGVMARVREAEGKADDLKDKLKKLKDAEGKAVGVISKIIPHLIDIGMGAASGAVELSSAKDAADTTKAWLGISKDIADELKSIYDDAS